MIWIFIDLTNDERLKRQTCLNIEGCSGCDTMGWDGGAVAGTLEWGWAAGGACEAAGVCEGAGAGAWDGAGVGAWDGAGVGAWEEADEVEERPCRGILKKIIGRHLWEKVIDTLEWRAYSFSSLFILDFAT